MDVKDALKYFDERVFRHSLKFTIKDFLSDSKLDLPEYYDTVNKFFGENVLGLDQVEEAVESGDLLQYHYLGLFNIFSENFIVEFANLLLDSEQLDDLESFIDHYTTKDIEVYSNLFYEKGLFDHKILFDPYLQENGLAYMEVDFHDLIGATNISESNGKYLEAIYGEGMLMLGDLYYYPGRFPIEEDTVETILSDVPELKGDLVEGESVTDRLEEYYMEYFEGELAKVTVESLESSFEDLLRIHYGITILGSGGSGGIPIELDPSFLTVREVINYVTTVSDNPAYDFQLLFEDERPDLSIDYNNIIDSVGTLTGFIEFLKEEI